VLDYLNAVPTERLERMAESARAVRPAFLYASRYSPDHLAAQDFILAELCHQVRRERYQNTLDSGRY